MILRSPVSCDHSLHRDERAGHLQNKAEQTAVLQRLYKFLPARALDLRNEIHTCPVWTGPGALWGRTGPSCRVWPVKLQQRGEGVLVTPKREPEEDLSDEEIETIDWVLANYGRMTSTEISNLSHQEKAYRFTWPGEEIAYRYAVFFETLPDKKDVNGYAPRLLMMEIE